MMRDSEQQRCGMYAPVMQDYAGAQEMASTGGGGGGDEASLSQFANVDALTECMSYGTS